MAKGKDKLKIKRQEGYQYKVTLEDGSHETFKAREFKVFNGDVIFYDKMNRVVKTYSSDTDIEVK